MEFIDWQAADGIGRLTLTRPPLNVIHIPLMREALAALQTAREAGVRALALRAEGKLFSAGVDVADHTADKVGEMIPLFDALCTALVEFPVPTLAVVQGHALGGGCELALSCDLIVSAETANFGQPEIKLATIAPIAALRLPGFIGHRRAAELLLLGDVIPATEAARIGLINRAVPLAELEATAEAYLTKLRGLSAAALRLCKRALRVSDLATMERLYLDELMATEDAREGVQAFIEKRAPVWKHQ